jgi:hypothetical protein
VRVLRRTLPVVVAFLVGTLMVVEYFFKVDVLKSLAEQVRSWVVLVATFALGLGAVNLLQIQAKKTQTRAQGWPFAIVLVVAFAVTVVLGLTQGPQSKAYSFVFQSMLVAPGSTLYAMLAFFIASASYRAFRARNTEATVLLLSALLVMLGKVPIGEVISSFFPSAQAWIMKIPNVAGQRGIMIATSLGIMAISLKIILGYNRDYLGGKD